MQNSQVPHLHADSLAPETELLDSLALIRLILQRLDLKNRQNRFIPIQDRRVRLPYVKA